MVEFRGLSEIKLNNIAQGDADKVKRDELTPEQIELFSDIGVYNCPVNAVPKSIFGAGMQQAFDFPSFEFNDFDRKSKYIPEPKSMRAENAKSSPTPIVVEPAKDNSVEEIDSSDVSDKKHNITFAGEKLEMDVTKSVDKDGNIIFTGEMHIDGGVIKYKKTVTKDGEMVMIVLQNDDGSLRAECTTDNEKAKSKSVEEHRLDENGNMFLERESETFDKQSGMSNHGYGCSSGDGLWNDFMDIYDADGNHQVSVYVQTQMGENPERVEIVGQTKWNRDGSSFEFIPNDANENIIVVEQGKGIISTRPQSSDADAINRQYVNQQHKHDSSNTEVAASVEPDNFDELSMAQDGGGILPDNIPLNDEEQFVPHLSDGTNQLYRTKNKED